MLTYNASRVPTWQSINYQTAIMVPTPSKLIMAAYLWTEMRSCTSLGCEHHQFEKPQVSVTFENMLKQIVL